MSYARKIVAGSTIVFAMHIVGGILAYLIRIFLAHSLSIGEFGLLYAVLSFVGLLTLFRDFGFGSTLTKFIADFHTKKDNESIKGTMLIVIGLELTAGAIIAAVVIMFSGTISTHLFKVPATDILIVVVASFAISGLIAMQFVFQGLGNIGVYAAIEPVRSFLTLLFSAVLIGMGIIGVAYGYLLAAMLTSIILFFLVARELKFFSLKAKISRELAKTIVLFSLPVFFTSIGSTILGYTDTLAITYFLSVKEVGLYQAAFPTSQLLWVLVSSVSVVFLPLAASIYTKGNKETLGEITGHILKFSFAAAIPAVMLLMAFPDVAIRMLFGEAYVAASFSLQILALTTFFYALFSITSTSLLAIGKPKVNVKIVSFIAVLDLALNIVLIPVIGIEGAAISTFMSYLVASVISIRSLRKYIAMKFYWAGMTKAFIGGCIGFAIVVYIKNSLSLNPWVELAISGLVMAPAYLIFVLFSGALTKKDVEILKNGGIPVPGFMQKLAR